MTQLIAFLILNLTLTIITVTNPVTTQIKRKFLYLINLIFLLIVVFGWNEIIVTGINYINNYKTPEQKIEKTIEGTKQFLKDTEQFIDQAKKKYADKPTHEKVP